MFTHSALLGMLLAMAHLPVIAMETCSAGNPGLPGIPGMPGRDGRNGEKGEKGEPGMPLMPGQVAQKGQKGERGEKGPVGKIGPSGVKGPPGFPGTMGPPGDKGDATVYEKKLKSAFSVSRRTDVYPQKNSPVIFKHVITNINNHFNTETGKFVCHIPGTYYFVFHTSSKDSLCVSLMKDGKGLASFCDHSHNLYQVSSGGLSVYLNMNEAVWLETSDNQGMIGIRGKESIFSGFLVKPH